MTAGIYTHVLVADKADELAKLPAIGMRRNDTESAARTGTTDTAFPQPPKRVDRPADRCGNDFNRQITTYSDAGKGEKRAARGMAKNEKPPVSQGKTGAYNMAITTGLEPATSRSTVSPQKTSIPAIPMCYAMQKILRTPTRTPSPNSPPL
jgi:hypothetical protein